MAKHTLSMQDEQRPVSRQQCVRIGFNLPADGRLAGIWIPASCPVLSIHPVVSVEATFHSPSNRAAGQGGRRASSGQGRIRKCFGSKPLQTNLSVPGADPRRDLRVAQRPAGPPDSRPPCSESFDSRVKIAESGHDILLAVAAPAKGPGCTLDGRECGRERSGLGRNDIVGRFV